MQQFQDIVTLYEACFSDEIVNILWEESCCVVRYEDLVHSPATNIKKVMRFIDLEFEMKQLNFSKNKNISHIKTPSFRQVNKPLYKSSLSNSQPYKKLLGRDVDRLVKFEKIFGYD